MNADILTEIDVTALVEFHHLSGGAATIALTRRGIPSLFGVVPIDGRGQVEAFIEKPLTRLAPTKMINAGVYVLGPSFLDRVPAGRRVSVEREVFPALAEDGRFMPSGQMRSGPTWAPRRNTSKPTWRGRDGKALVGAGPRTHPEADVVNSVLHPDVTVEKGATVREAVILEGGRVRAGAFVNRSVLGRNVIVGHGSVVDDLSVLGDGWVVAAGDVLKGARLPAGV